MYPILFSVGPVVVSSFGVFLGAGFLAAVFICWRVARAYDLDEEKMLDLSIMTLLIGLLGSRLFFVAGNWGIFTQANGSWQDILAKIALINRFPGLSLWGGILGGGLALLLFSRSFKLNFWQIADFAAVSLAIGLVFGEIGCLLGGCGYGLPANFLLAAPVTGVVGKRFPLPFVESVVFFLAFLYLWGQVIRFHFNGRIAALILIFLGAEKLVADFYRGDRLTPVLAGLTTNQMIAALLVIAGAVIFYRRAKRSLRADVVNCGRFLISSQRQKKALFHLQKNWYNQRVSWALRVQAVRTGLKKAPGSVRRILNVKPTPKNFN